MSCGYGYRWVVLWTTALVISFAGCGDDAEVTVNQPTGGAGAVGGSSTGGSGGTAGAGATGGNGCASGIVCGPTQECCDAGEECVNYMQCLPLCEGTRCGDNLVDCCTGSQICLDGVVCAADCAFDETLCGAQLDTCCPDGQVCLSDGCITPGDECENNYDCLLDNWYCDEVLGHCLPLPPGELCQGTAQFHNIEPVLEWYWPGIWYEGYYFQNILAAPIVGDVSGDGIPDVVVVVYRDSEYSQAGGTLVVVLNGAGDGAGHGEVLFTIPSAQDPTAARPYGLSTVALGNFDTDAGLEIVYNMMGGGVRIADNDGVGSVCDSTTYPGCTGERTVGAGAGTEVIGGPSLADIDHDGTPDVIIRCHVLNGKNISDPTLDFLEIACPSNVGDTVVADVDQDGWPDVVGASYAMSTNPALQGAGGGGLLPA